MVDHIDLMIENEKMHKKQGWISRIKTLQAFRKRALIHNDVETFHREAHTIGVYGKRNKRDKKSVFQHDTSLVPTFWNMGMKGFRNFFKTLGTMSTKSLQIIRYVLYERNRLEVTIKNLEPKVDVGLSKVSQLKAEMKLFADHKADIADSKDIEYTVS
ncbi:hypothetical protein MAR_007364 [Mya arenaria]|uniref:Uncharacterized protein n=1 Tax=Mya arenaria TaxID=6604 RepID=A0ABY7DC82_MYAAR|nr:hypothetical protein MAR_007364 [Mya arenaria]